MNKSNRQQEKEQTGRGKFDLSAQQETKDFCSICVVVQKKKKPPSDDIKQ